MNTGSIIELAAHTLDWGEENDRLDIQNIAITRNVNNPIEIDPVRKISLAATL